MAGEKHGKKTGEEQSAIDNKLKASLSRRSFFKKALIGVAAVGVTGAIAKKTADHLLPEADNQQAYLDDVLPGDKILSSWQYVEMKKSEKEALVKTLVTSYRDKA